MSEQRSIEIMKQIFAGVDYLHHNLGIAHRDLSLENVLMHNRQCKISDFGLSVGINERCAERVGKNYYMAPEVVAGEEYNPVQADIWSLGIIWFILLTGSPLISIASKQNQAFIALEQCGVAEVFVSWKCNDNLSTSIIELISQMLKVDPAERVSIKEILEHPSLN